MKDIVVSLMSRYPHLQESQTVKAIDHIRSTFAFSENLDQNFRQIHPVETDRDLANTINGVAQKTELGTEARKYLELIADNLRDKTCPQNHSRENVENRRQSLWVQSTIEPSGLGHSGPSS